MKNKLLYILTIIFCIGISSGITFVVVENKFNNLKKEENKTITEVNITEENTIKSSVDKINDAVVLVKSYYYSRYVGSGTGFVYKVDDNYGYILTCNHVIENATNVTVLNNNHQEVEATVLGGDEYADIAVLRIDKDAVMDVAKIGNSSNLEIGDNLFTVGSPLGEKYMGTVTKGILSGKNRTIDVNLSNGTYRMDVLQTDAAINPGNSGGPLVNINGEVVGVTSSKLVRDEVEGMGFAIPIEIAISATSLLEKGEPMTRPVIGADYVDVTSAYSLYLNRIKLDSSIKYGAVITRVDEDYPAFKAGLQKGDVIISIDDMKVEDSIYLRYVLYKHNINDKIKITIVRGKEQKELELVLDKSV